ncbi:MAG: serine hydroxymethyltransferase, partial [Planctomycetota bacterium]|nr:serine hydroxymethyltransferase [Planctomycetota bacterium]
YKGVEYADIIEATAQKRVCELFATKEYPPDSIYANVQPLSGAAANNAVYNAFLSPGDTVMGMNLTFGGHLTHGSPANRSGRFFRVVSYTADRLTGKLDYAKIKELAVQVNPKLIIAGYSAYPWAPDWGAFREIADSCGAILLADIAHTAGLVVGGVQPNPIGYADVITFTTHKSLCGPRGACILTTNPEYAEALNNAVFPGEQGGPHIHQVAAKAVCFKLAATEEFKRLMKRVVDNAKVLGEALKENGIPLAYGGTDTHLVMVDLGKIRTKNGERLTGEIVSRIFDMAHITLNKNTIGGDTDAAHPGAVRFGTVWASQRGMGAEEMKKIARLSAKLFTNIEPFFYIDTKGKVGRGKIESSVLEEVRSEVVLLLERFPAFEDLPAVDYPHLFGVEKKISSVIEEGSLPKKAKVEDGVILHYGNPKGEEEVAIKEQDGVIVDLQGHFCVIVRGRRAEGLLDSVLSCDVRAINRYECTSGYIMNREGKVLDEVLVARIDMPEYEDEEFLVVGGYRGVEHLTHYLRMASDGYIYADRDIYKKVEGPAVILEVGELKPPLMALKLVGKDVLGGLSALSMDLKQMKINSARWVAVEKERVLVVYAPFGGDYGMALVLAPCGLIRRIQERLLNKGLKMVGVLAVDSLRQRLRLPLIDPLKPVSAVQLYKDGYRDLFALGKFFFVGQDSLAEFQVDGPKLKEFSYSEPKDAPLKRTALYEEHKRLSRHIIPFAGWEMPVWYSRVTEEHQAVRTSAGLFDVSHMGLLEFEGRDAGRFLDIVLSNYVPFFYEGQAFYAYLCNPDGEVIDDTFTYKLGKNRYWVVVNASNTEKDIEWFKGVLEGKYIIDRRRPSLSFSGNLTIKNLKEERVGSARRTNIAVQGPNSLLTLVALADSPTEAAKLKGLRRSEFVWVKLARSEIMVARTGYTGEKVAFEIYIPTEDARRIWNEILNAGEKYGLK